MVTMYNTKIYLWWVFILVATFETLKYGCVEGIGTLDENDFEAKPKETVKTIEVSEDGYLIDCVDIYKQPALDNSSIKDLQMEPSLSYQSVFNNTNNPLFDKIKTRPPEEIQNWHKYGQCPLGTIPIRRKWKNNGTIFRKGPRNQVDHEYATGDQLEGRTYHGAGATFNIWMPYVSEDEFSLTQIWVSSGDGPNKNTIEVGWMVYPRRYRSSWPHFFTYWTADGYQHGCYDDDCPGTGFRQVADQFCIGCPIRPVSQYEGESHSLRFTVNRDWITGHWWLYYENIKVGYFPRELFTTLGNGADGRVDFGGEILNYKAQGHHTVTDMGSGHFSHEGPTRASFVRNIIVVNEYGAVEDASLRTFVTNSSCYDIRLGQPGTTSGTYFYYGGPGYSDICP